MTFSFRFFTTLCLFLNEMLPRWQWAVTMTILLSFRMPCLLLTAELWEKKKHVGSLFSNMRPTLIPAKGKASSYWLTPREHLYPDWRKLVGSVYPVVSQLVSSHSFPLPRLKMMERRFNARKAFCGSQVRNISCTMADIWKASKYRRLDLYDTAKVIWWKKRVWPNG